jgi:hypothetical protein
VGALLPNMHLFGGFRILASHGNLVAGVFFANWCNHVFSSAVVTARDHMDHSEWPGKQAKSEEKRSRQWKGD